SRRGAVTPQPQSRGADAPRTWPGRPPRGGGPAAPRLPRRSTGQLGGRADGRLAGGFASRRRAALSCAVHRHSKGLQLVSRREATVDRRTFVKQATLGAAGAGTLGALGACGNAGTASGEAEAGQVTVSGPQVTWRVASSFPRGLDAIYGAAEALAQRVSA